LLKVRFLDDGAAATVAIREAQSFRVAEEASRVICIVQSTDIRSDRRRASLDFA
jgi:hypothetical protein